MITKPVPLHVPPATAESDMIAAGPSPFRWVKKTLTEFKALLGLVITAGKTITCTQNTSLDEAVAMSSKLTLALGAANLKAFMNAAATAPEWATGIKIGTFTRDMAAVTADVAYTSVGFKPSMVLFAGAVASTVYSSYFGIDDGTTHFCTSRYDNVDLTSGNCINLRAAAGAQWAQIKTLDADGFTLTWTKYESPAAGTGTLYYVAFR